MKNHMKIDKQIYQTNKKFSALKESQKEKISIWCYEGFRLHYIENGKLARGKGDDFVLNYVFSKIDEAEIWISETEVIRFYKSRKIRLTHKLQKEFPEICVKQRTIKMNKAVAVLSCVLSLCAVSCGNQAEKQPKKAVPVIVDDADRFDKSQAGAERFAMEDDMVTELGGVSDLYYYLYPSEIADAINGVEYEEYKGKAERILDNLKEDGKEYKGCIVKGSRELSEKAVKGFDMYLDSYKSLFLQDESGYTAECGYVIELESVSVIDGKEESTDYEVVVVYVEDNGWLSSPLDEETLESLVDMAEENKREKINEQN